MAGCVYQALFSNDQTADTDALNKYLKTACTGLPQDENLDVRNMSKTL
jgi:hypothetical protein